MGPARDLFRCIAGQGGGTDLISRFEVGKDKLDLGGNTIKSGTFAGGGMNLKLSDGTTLILSGISKLTNDMFV